MTATGTTEPINWKQALNSPQRRLSILLWLVAAHSFFVGLGLILLPDGFLSFFGFAQGGERFFRAQAGVFHFVMVVVYTMAAVRCASSPDLTEIAIAAKFMATAFLISYYLFAEAIWSVLLSGLIDGALGAVITWALIACRRRVVAIGAGPSG